MTTLRALLTDLPSPAATAAAAVQARVDDILRPQGALQRLDEVAIWMAGWQATITPAVHRPVGVLFAADHGVAASKAVSAYPPEVTAAMLEAARQQRTTLHALAAVAGAEVVTVDVGVGAPTGDIRHEPALDQARFDEVVATAIATIEEVGADLLVLGEMGIGNTTVAAALAHACLGGDVTDWVGRGTGVDDEGLARKQAAVQTASDRVRRIENPADPDDPHAADEHDADEHDADEGLVDPLEMLGDVGGAELVAVAAAIMAARHRRIPVVLDGYVVAAAALPLVLAEPTALDHCIAGHVSAEPGHRRLLDELARTRASSTPAAPLLDLGLRLGEGSGAMAAVPLIAMACRAVTDVPTFAEWFAQ